MVYLIGVAHRVQYTNDKSDPGEIMRFSAFLEMKALKLKITCIAEELNAEVLREKKATACTALAVTRKLNIEHRFCEPDRSEREALGIPSERIHTKAPVGDGDSRKDIGERIRKEREKYFELRERFWIDRIEDKIDEPIFFICGADHVGSFGTLLSEKGYDVEVLIEDWTEPNRQAPLAFLQYRGRGSLNEY
ncbi:MAG: hypothetical protein AB1442_01380 [Nitrospirota bacterium]